jgi:hypothetical protein
MNEQLATFFERLAAKKMARRILSRIGLDPVLGMGRRALFRRVQPDCRIAVPRLRDGPDFRPAVFQPDQGIAHDKQCGPHSDMRPCGHCVSYFSAIPFIQAAACCSSGRRRPGDCDFIGSAREREKA